MADSDPIPEDLALRHSRMLERHLADRGITNGLVLKAMAEVPRHEFVPFSSRVHAYDDSPLRIGCGQTISQPYIVAYMTQLLEIEPGMKVLEIGTGSGYQTAVLAAMGARVYTVERHEQLSSMAEEVLDRLGYGENLWMRVDDGSLGWPEEAPFDRILVTAAGPEIPPSLERQLADNGRMVIPVGSQRDGQTLTVIHKKDGQIRRQHDLAVVFVPLIGQEGFGGKD